MPARQRRLADFAQYFKEQGLFALEVPVQNRLRDAGRPRDLFRGRVLVAKRDEQMLGLSEELSFAVGFAHAKHIPGWLNPATLGGTHRLPHRFRLQGGVSNDYSIGMSVGVPDQVSAGT